MERLLTCIVCPKGCSLKINLGEGGEIIEISGNACKRGVSYATDECTHPKRTVTSTVRCVSGEVVPVKTSGAVPKELVFEVMKKINTTEAPDGLSIGDVVISDVLGTGVNVVATANAKK